MRRTDRSRRAGFSLLEALVTLAVTAIALSLLFGLANGTAASGFRLGRGAAASADARIGGETLRLVLGGMAVPGITPRGAGSGPGLEGAAETLTAESAPGRATLCGGPAALAPVTLALARGEDRRLRLTCSPGGPDARTVVLADLGTGRAAFRYSPDGRAWSSDVQMVGGPATSAARARRLWVRLAGEDGRTFWVERLGAAPSPT